MSRILAAAALLLLLLPAARAQEAPTAAAAESPSQVALHLEQRLLSLDLLSYNESRERERRAREKVNDVLGRLDQALAGDAVALGTLEALQDELATARAAAQGAGDRLNDQLGRIEERLRRIALLDGGQPAARPAANDPLTGRWRVSVGPRGVTATFDLRLSGAVVSGTYQVAGGTAGSFRGSFVNGSLRLERIDSGGGFDSVWEGTVANGRIAGTWTTNELVTGQPTRGTWTAVREGGSQP
ncbi:MAG: hypothetical protein ACJ75H_02915 [Thermoanaerobaculia bacterium]